MRERKMRHRQKCRGGRRETGKRDTRVWGEGVENARPHAMERRKCNDEQNCKLNNEHT